MEKNKVKKEKVTRDTDYLWSMSHAPKIEEGIYGLQLIPLIFFTAFVILIVRLVPYTRPMDEFYWSNSGNDIVDFFSYGKMVIILICATVAVLCLLYRLLTQALAIHKTAFYIPMLVYAALVILSYVFSDYKEFSFLGANDRFEGTLVLLSYMVMLFYAINSIKTERAVKHIVCALAGSSVILCLLGVTQALDHDFFRTQIGKMLITPKVYWGGIDSFTFTFENKQIYQTVYNINYVSFYLTLLLPLFGLLFIRSVMKGKEEAIWKKILWAALFALLLFNLIGSASSGGFLGMGVVVLVAISLLNKKILDWRKPLFILIAITLAIGAATSDRWGSELRGTFNSVQQRGTVNKEQRSHIDYLNILDEEYAIELGIDGNKAVFMPEFKFWPSVIVYDSEGNEIILLWDEEAGSYLLDDSRFNMVSLELTESKKREKIFVINTDGRAWRFLLTKKQISFVNDLGKNTELKGAEAIGWSNNLSFGSGRGYIWSRTLPMIKDTILIGHGADTYCMYFPHNDYIGKYNAGWNLNMIVDKPHNMYMGMAVGTGLISVFAFLAMLVLYTMQSIRLFWRRRLDSFTDYAGVGVFLGIVGFSVAGLVNDSSVSVMPMFYGLLGTGIAINMILKRTA